MLLLLRFVTSEGILRFQADIFDVLSVKVNVFFDECLFLKSLCNFIWKSFLTWRNLIFFTKSMRSSSNSINSLSCREHLLLFKPYTQPLVHDLVVFLLLYMKKIVFHRIFLWITRSFLSAVVYIYIYSFSLTLNVCCTLSSQQFRWLGDTYKHNVYDEFWNFKFHLEDFRRNTPFLSFDGATNYLDEFSRPG